MNNIESKNKIRQILNKHKKLVDRVQKSNKQEVKNVKDSHTGRMLQLEDKNYEAIINERAKGEKHILAQIDQSEKKLKEISDNLKKTEQALNDKEEYVRDYHYQKMSAFGKVAEDQYQKRYDETQAYTDQLKDDAYKQRAEIREDLDQGTSEERLKAYSALNQAMFDYHDRVDDARFKTQRKLKVKEQQFRDKVEQQKVDIAHQEIDIRSKHTRELDMLKQSQQMELDDLKAASDYNVKNTRARMEARLIDLKDQHQKAIDNQTLLAANALNNIKNQYTESVTHLDNKLEDPFYSISSLSPDITDLGTEYEIKIDVPEHEKDLVTVNTFKRTIRLTMARKYHSKTIADDGTENRTNRSESVTKEFKVDDILDAKKVSNRYEDGVLIYNIAKA